MKLTQPLTVSVKEKGGKPDRKSYGLINSYRNLKSENSQDYASMKLYVHEFGFWRDEDTENAPPKVRKRPRVKADVRK